MPLNHCIDDFPLLQQGFLFAELARVAYYRPDIVSEAAKAVGFEYFEFFDEDGAQAYIFENQYDCVVVCRGTEPND